MASQTEQSRDVVKRYAEVGIPRVLAGDRDAAHEYLADHYVQHTSSHHKPGKQSRDDMKDSIEEAVKAIPNLRFTVDRYIADGDHVATHWRIAGTHSGRHKHRHADEHLTGTCADVEIHGMTLYRVEHGTIVESWGYDTHLDALIELGALKISA